MPAHGSIACADDEQDKSPPGRGEMLRGGQGVDDDPAPFPPGAAADRGTLILPHPGAVADLLAEDVLPPLLAVADSLPDIFSGGAAMEAHFPKS